MTKRNAITQAYLKSRLHYDPKTGRWRWRPRPVASWHDIAWNKRRSGTIAGKSVNGYIQIRMDGRCYYAHRLAFLYIRGRLPKHDVDHINGHRSDCRWSNLREATRTENVANSSLRKDNTTGHRGIRWRQGYWQWIPERWRAVIQHEGVNEHLGYFKTKAEAVAAYRQRAKELRGVFARLD